MRTTGTTISILQEQNLLPLLFTFVHETCDKREKSEIERKIYAQLCFVDRNFQQTECVCMFLCVSNILRQEYLLPSFFGPGKLLALTVSFIWFGTFPSVRTAQQHIHTGKQNDQKESINVDIFSINVSKALQRSQLHRSQRIKHALGLMMITTMMRLSRSLPIARETSRQNR